MDPLIEKLPHEEPPGLYWQQRSIRSVVALAEEDEGPVSKHTRETQAVVIKRTENTTTTDYGPAVAEEHKRLEADPAIEHGQSESGRKDYFDTLLAVSKSVSVEAERNLYENRQFAGNDPPGSYAP